MEPQIGHPSNAQRIEELEKYISKLETEIRFYSSKAAEVMVQGTEDNTFKIETEKKLEMLKRYCEEVKILKSVQTEIPISSSYNSYQQQQHSSPMNNMSVGQAIPASVVPPAIPNPQLQTQQPPQSSQLQQQPHQQVSRKQLALNQAEKRSKGHTLGDAVFFCSIFLEYNDLVASACVNKYWRHRMRRTPGWRRCVFNFECTLTGHIGRITALTQYEAYVVTGSADGKIKFWDPTKNFQCVKTLNITPSPAAAALSKYVHPKLRELRESRIHPEGVAGHEEDENAEYPVAVTALLTVDKCVVIGGQDGRFIIWMTGTADKREFEFDVFKGALTCIVVGAESAQDFIFLSSSDGRLASFYRKGFPFNPVAGPNPTIINSTKKHDQGISALAYAGNHVFSGDLVGKIFVWQQQPHGLEFKKVLQQDRGNGLMTEHRDRITSMVGLGDRLYTASWDGTIKYWNARTLELLRDICVLPIGICWSLAIRRDMGSKINLIAGVRDSDVCIMDCETLEVLSSCQQNSWAYKLDQHNHWVKSIMAFEGRIVTGSDDWTVKVWQVRGVSSSRPPPMFLGLPPGPISEEDLDIILSKTEKNGQRVDPKQLQLQKQHYDLTLKEKLPQMSKEQIQEQNNHIAKAQETWTRWRNERRARKAAENPDSVKSAENNGNEGQHPNVKIEPGTETNQQQSSLLSSKQSLNESSSNNIPSASPQSFSNGPSSSPIVESNPETPFENGSGTQSPLPSSSPPTGLENGESTNQEEEGGESDSSDHQANKRRRIQ